MGYIIPDMDLGCIM